MDVVSSQMGHMLKACLITGKWLDRQGVYLLSGLIPQWFTWCYYWEAEKGKGALEKAPIVPGPFLSFWTLAAKSEQLLPYLQTFWLTSRPTNGFSWTSTGTLESMNQNSLFVFPWHFITMTRNQHTTFFGFKRKVCL